MGLFKKAPQPAYDRARQRPVLRISICTGEQVAGFEDRKTGQFEDRMLIRSAKDLQTFCRRYHLSPDELVRRY